MKKYINIIISSISLFVTTALLIISMFAWYVLNETAEASGIIAATDSVRGSFDFYYFNDTSTESEESGQWIKSNNDLKINDAWPDDVFYFKIVGSNLDEGQKLNISFKGISSIINKEYVTGHKIDDDNYEIRYSGYKHYTSSSTSFDVDYSSETKTLYELSESEDFDSGYEVNLKDILIQDVFKIYTNPTFKTVGSMTDFPNSKGTSSININGTIYNEEITEADNGTKTIYFALSFDSQGDALDNYYQFQGINISNISISLG